MKFSRITILLGLIFIIFLTLQACRTTQPVIVQADINEANNLDHEAFELYRQGKYIEAIQVVQKSLTIREKALGPDHPDTTKSLSNLALLYSSMGDYAKAEPLYQRTLTICEKSLGPEHPDTAASLHNLAMLYGSMGDYAKAESLYQRALAIREKSAGPDSPATAQSLNNLALLYDSMGDYAKAEPLYQRALAICEKTHGPEHSNTAKSANNLAMLYYSMGEYAKAKPLYQRALAIHEKILGPEQPDTATNLNNLALLYNSMGDYAKAEPLYQRALAICEKALGPEHPNTAKSLNNLALLYSLMGDYAKAKPLHQQALAICEKTHGPEHPDTASSLYNLAILHANLNEFSKAHKLNLKAQKASEKLIDQVMGFTSEDQKIKFLAKQNINLQTTISLVAFHMQTNPAAQKDIFDIWLRRKGIILEAQKQYQEALVYSDNSEAVKVFQELSRTRSRLSKLYFSRPDSSNLETYHGQIADLENQKDKLEGELSRLSQSFALYKDIRHADSKKLAAELPEKTVLLEIAKVRRFNFKAKGIEKKWLPDHYLVFVLHAGNQDKLSLIDLGAAEAIDKTILKLKQQLQEGDNLTAGKKLYEMVFTKIKPKLEQTKEVFISPDGNLNLIPFEILQDPNGRFLIEDYTFNYLSAGRDLLGFGKQKGKPTKSLLIGDPDFDLGKPAIPAPAKKTNAQSKTAVSGKRSAAMRGMHFGRLPGTLDEVKAINQIIGHNKSTLITGDAALEQILIQAKAPRILHIATHGFFLSDQELSGLADDRGLMVTGSTPKIHTMDNPLLRSGLAFAGANSALKSNDTKMSQGLFTAEKVLGLRLMGTELVVLSACDTGMGEVQTGEGVYGLRRAFIQSGTKGLVMSMWPVPDTETKELMIQFYTNIQSGMSRSQALRQAALKEKEIVEKRHGSSNPKYWGAFVFLGEP